MGLGRQTQLENKLSQKERKILYGNNQFLCQIHPELGLDVRSKTINVAGSILRGVRISTQTHLAIVFLSHCNTWQHVFAAMQHGFTAVSSLRTAFSDAWSTRTKEEVVTHTTFDSVIHGVNKSIACVHAHASLVAQPLFTHVSNTIAFVWLFLRETSCPRITSLYCDSLAHRILQEVRLVHSHRFPDHVWQALVGIGRQCATGR